MGKFTFESAKDKARGIARNPERLKNLYLKAAKKLSKTELKQENFDKFKQEAYTFLRMIRAYWTGAYRETPWKSLVLIVATLIYFVNPLDLIPDFIPATGFIDDISLLLMVFNSVKNDVDDFVVWEHNQSYQN